MCTLPNVDKMFLYKNVNDSNSIKKKVYFLGSIYSRVRTRNVLPYNINNVHIHKNTIILMSKIRVFFHIKINLPTTWRNVCFHYMCAYIRRARVLLLFYDQSPINIKLYQLIQMSVGVLFSVCVCFDIFSYIQHICILWQDQLKERVRALYVSSSCKDKTQYYCADASNK